jgi:hypothetical protein
MRCADYATPLYPQTLTLTLPTSGDHSVGIVRSRTQSMFFFINTILNLHYTPLYVNRTVLTKRIKYSPGAITENCKRRTALNSWWMFLSSFRKSVKFRSSLLKIISTYSWFSSVLCYTPYALCITCPFITERVIRDNSVCVCVCVFVCVSVV